MPNFLSLRLFSHFPLFKTPHDVVAHMGAMQAQDIHQALRCVGSRMISGTKEIVKKSLAEGKIIRTRPMRGTLHYLAPENVHRMLDLCASKTLNGFKKRREFLWISDAHAEKALSIILKSLKGGKALTRSQLGEALKLGGIPMETQRVYHLACYAATRKLICFGPATDKEETFVLLDERLASVGEVAQPRLRNRDEQLAHLALMYANGHGPVTVDDLARRTGLTKTDCKTAFALVADQLETLDHQGKTYFYKSSPFEKGGKGDFVRLLGGFDEYFLGYKDRSPVADMQHHGKLFTTNGIFFPLILVNGQVVGTWKRTVKKETVTIALTPLPGVKLPMKEIEQEAEKYRKFLGLENTKFE